MSGAHPWLRRPLRRRLVRSLTVGLISLQAGAGCRDGEGPTEVPADALTLQAGNSNPTIVLAPKPSGELSDNRVGAQLYGQGLWIEITDAYRVIRDDILHSGVKRLQTSLNENEPPIDWNASEFEIPPEFDQLVDDMIENGVVVDYLLHFWDKGGQGETLSTPRFQDDEQVEAFLEYVRFIVGHFGGRIEHYTIWSEPDNCGQGGIKCIEPEDYIRLAMQVIPVIREEDPAAKVGIGPVVLFHARDYLLSVLSSDVATEFDVIQWHGQYNVVPDEPFYGSYYYDYPAIVEEIKEVASAHGFSGDYWSTEMGWCSEEEVSPSCHVWEQTRKLSTDRLAAKYAARGIVMHLGMDVGVGIESVGEWHGPWGFPTRRRLYTIMAGATPTDVPVTIEGATAGLRLQSFGFELPDGDRLFAVWTDEAAVDEDPGQKVTLIFPGMSVTSAFAVDVLQGFELQLITSTEAGDLLIRDVLVRDYPLIVRLER